MDDAKSDEILFNIDQSVIIEENVEVSKLISLKDEKDIGVQSETDNSSLGSSIVVQKNEDSSALQKSSDSINLQNDDDDSNTLQKSDDSIQIFKCSKCSEQFSRLSQLSRHSRSHAPSTKQNQGSLYECHICNETYSHHTNYLIHMRLHNSSKSKVHVCKECGASFSQSGHLLIHQKTHNVVKSFNCGICNVTYNQIADLKAHIRAHNEPRPYKCEVCPAVFTESVSLERHNDIHTKELDYLSLSKCNDHVTFAEVDNQPHGGNGYQCPVCDVRLESESELSNHTKIHITMLYSCEHCHASFSKPDSLDNHMICHLNETKFQAQKNGSNKNSKLFTCNSCNAVFYDKRDLKHHVFLVHKYSSYVKDSMEIESNNLVIDEMQFPPASSTVIIDGRTNSVENIVLAKEGGPSSPEIEIIPPCDRVGQKSHFLVSSLDAAAKPLRSVGQCQNHSQHVIAMVEGNPNEWQTLCSCDPPNIPGMTTTQILVPVQDGDHISSLNPVYMSGPIQASMIDSSTQVIMTIGPQGREETSGNSHFSINNSEAVFTETSEPNTYYISAPSDLQNDVMISSSPNAYYNSV